MTLQKGIVFVVALMICSSAIAGRRLPVSFSTYKGGNGQDSVRAVKTDHEGNIYIAGHTTSTDYPTTNAFMAAKTPGANSDVFVAKFASDGKTLIYLTYLGGANDEILGGMDIDDAGNVVIAGTTESADFPVTNAYQDTIGGGGADLFVSGFTPDGQLAYSTFIGGTPYESPVGSDCVSLDSSGNIYLVATVSGSGFPVKNAVQPTFGGATDAVLVKLTPDAADCVYATYFGGTGNDYDGGIAATDSGRAYATFRGNSSDIITTNAMQAASAGGDDVYVTKFSADGSQLLFSTYLGGTGFDASKASCADGSEDLYVAVCTRSTNFPTVNSYRSYGYQEIEDVAVFKMNADGASLEYSTYLAGWEGDWPEGIAVDSTGSVWVCGMTDSSTNIMFPTTLAAFRETWPGGTRSAFVSQLSPDGSDLIYSTLLGGDGNDRAYGVAVDRYDNVYVCGDTLSTNFPVFNAYQSAPGTAPASTDGFLMEFIIGKPPFLDMFSGTNVTGRAADLGGDIFATHGFPVVERGIYWSITNGFADGEGTKVSETGSFGEGTFMVSVTGLVMGTTYYFKAFGRNQAGDGYSATISFTTLDLPRPAGGKALSERMPTFEWEPVAGAEWYRIWLTKDGSRFYSPWVEANTMWTPPADLPGGNYQWWVRPWTTAGGDGTWSAAETFSIPVAEPGAAVPLSPAGIVETNRPEFAWTNVIGADWYRLAIERDNVLFYDEWISTTNRVPSNDLSFGTYKWWVRTWSADGFGPWSSPQTFAYGRPVCIAPTGTLAAAPTEFRWDDTRTHNATWYKIWIHRGGVDHTTFWMAAGDTTDAGGSERIWTADFVLPAGSYDWWVRAYDATSHSLWSDKASFTVP